MSLRMAGSLMSGALLGKVLGFAREIEMARLLGANVVADGFRGALTGVLLPVAPLQSDMLPSVLIPMHRAWGAQAPARSAALAIVLTLFATLIAAMVWVLAAPWVGVLVGSFDADAQALTVRFVRVMALAIPASVLSACLSAVEIAVGRSRIAASRAAVQNVAMMLGIAVTAWTGQALAIPWSFAIGFNLIGAYAVATLARAGAITLAGVDWALLRGVGAAFYRRFRPLLTIPLADQGNIFLERMLASGIAVGAVASMDYARTLTDSAFYLVSLPVGYVVLARAGAAHRDAAEIRRIAQPLLALGVSASVFIFVFSADIVTTVFARGAFDAHAVALTSGALRGISVGIWAAMLGWVLVRLVNAAGRNGAAAVIVVSAYGANAAFNVLAVPLLGTLGLGLGEAVRGLVLLGGTTIALSCGELMLRAVARAAAVGAALAACGWAIGSAVETPLLRLALAAPVFGCVCAAWLALHLPEQTRRLGAVFGRTRVAAGMRGTR